METVIRLKENVIPKRSKRRKRSKSNGNIDGKVKKVEGLDKPDSRKIIGRINTQASISKDTSVTRNLNNKSRSILVKEPVKLSPKPKTTKSKIANSISKDTISSLSCKANLCEAYISKSKAKNTSPQSYPQKPALLEGKINLDQNKTKKLITGNKNSANSKKLTEEVSVKSVKKSNKANVNRAVTSSKVKVPKVDKKAPRAPILKIVTNALNDTVSDDSKILKSTGIKNCKSKIYSSSKYSENSSRNKSNCVPKNPAKDEKNVIQNIKYTKPKEIHSYKYKPEILRDSSKKEISSEKLQNVSRHLLSTNSTAKGKFSRNHRITPDATKPVSIKGIIQNKAIKSLFMGKPEKKIGQIENISLIHSNNQKNVAVTPRKLFNPKTDNPISSNKPQSQILCQSAKYQDSLMVEIQRLTSLIDLENTLIDTDIVGWKRLVLNHNQLMLVYKKVILNHYETYNKMKTSWLKQSWETGTSKLLSQLDRIDITKNKLKYALIKTIISNSEQVYNDICITFNESPEFEGLRQSLLGELGANRVKNGLLNTNVDQGEDPKQALIDSTRKHLFKAISLNPNLGSAYHRLASFNILLDTKDILPCMLLYSISSVSDCSGYDTTKTLNELYQQYNWDPSPLHRLLQLFCKLAINESEEHLGDQINKWTRTHQNINWNCIDLFNLTVIGLIAYTDFGRKLKGLEYHDDNQIPIILLILALFDTNIKNLNTKQTEADHTLLVHSLLNLYLWINCNKLYPCQFNYSDPNPISISEGWSTIVNGLNLLYFNFSGWWDSTNITNYYSSNFTPMSWLDTFKSKIALIIGHQNTRIYKLNSTKNLNQTPSDCVKLILELGISWTKLPKSIIKFNSKNGFSIHMNSRVYSSQNTTANDINAPSLNSSDSDIVFYESHSTSGMASPIYSSEKIVRLKNRIKTLTTYINGNKNIELDFSQAKPEDFYLVFDTNFIINHIEFVEMVINLRSFRIIFPALAITELKGLCRDISISLKCNLILNLLSNLFSPPGPPEHIKIFTTQGNSVSHPHFVYERLPKSQHYKSKDIAILELCKLLSSRYFDKHIGLITEDKNMRIRARSSGIQIFSKYKVAKLMKNGSH